MSRVTIQQLHDDYNVVSVNAKAWGFDDKVDMDTYASLKTTEIVPRKIVEKIIEKAKEECSDVNNSYYTRKINHIWEYAESLLKQFEEGE